MSNSYQEKFNELESTSTAIKKKLEGGIKFKIKSDFQPSGDQPEAIKKIIRKKRVEISIIIKRHSNFNIGVSNNIEIDRYNILNATNISMKRAYSKFKETKFKIKIDGSETFKLNDRTSFHVKGDQKSITIAAASILAKVYRDDLMIKLSSDYPQYGWLKNKGYGTKEHIDAIHQFGISEYHRRSFLKNLNL